MKMKTKMTMIVAAAALCSAQLQGALRAWEPRDYVQDGLVLHLDGIRNAGDNAAHDSHATEWKDLSVSGNDLTLHYYDGEGGVGDGLNGERWNIRAGPTSMSSARRPPRCFSRGSGNPPAPSSLCGSPIQAKSISKMNRESR